MVGPAEAFKIIEPIINEAIFVLKQNKHFYNIDRRSRIEYVNYSHSYECWAASIAQWNRQRLPSRSPVFES